MNKGQSAKRVAVGTGLLLLLTVPVLAGPQGSPPAPAQIPYRTSPPPRARKSPTDIFAGLQYTEDQKAKINKIREDLKSRMEAVNKDEKLTPEQKGAFFQGFARMERSQIFEVLTPEQKMEVRKRMQAQRQDEQKDQDKKKLPHQG